MLLESIQSRLQTIYDLEPGYSVADFLITSQQQVAALDISENARTTDEKLLICQDAEELLVSLYVDQSVIDALGNKEPFAFLNEEKAASYCTALEGVSHFVYLTWNARHNRPVSQLEMELQAEVDKFVSLLSLYEEQGAGISAEELASWLFDDCRFDTNMKPIERDRYEMANTYAAVFCRRLIQELSRNGINKIAVTELRRFYRKRHQDKLRQCNNGDNILGP